MKRFPCEETTLELWLGELQVRLWITNDGATETVLDAIRERLAPLAGQVVKITGRPLEACIKLAEFYAVSGLPNLAAVQVSTAVGDGRVGHMIYTVGFD